MNQKIIISEECAKLELELKADRGLLNAIIDAAGGETLEGHPVSRVNILTRIRELRDSQEYWESPLASEGAFK